MEHNAAPSFVNLLQEMAADELGKRDSVEWAIVAGEGTVLEQRHLEESLQQTANTYLSVADTLWALNPTLTSFLDVGDLRASFVNYNNGTNSFSGFENAPDGTSMSLREASGFDDAVFPTSVLGPAPVSTPAEWIDYGPIRFQESTNASSGELIQWLLANASLVEGQLEKKRTIIQSSYGADEIPTDSVRYSVKLLSDADTLITGLLNQGPFSLSKGDYVMLYKIGGKLSNSYILGRGNSYQSPISSPASRSKTKEPTVVRQNTNTDVYSCTFWSYWAYSSPWELYYAAGHEALTELPAQGDIWWGTARMTIGGVEKEVGIWWPAGQIFDCVGPFGGFYTGARSITGLYYYYDQSYSTLNRSQVLTAMGNLSQKLAAAAYPATDSIDTSSSIVWQMPQQGDEILVIRKQPYYKGPMTNTPEFMVVNLIKKVWS